MAILVKLPANVDLSQSLIKLFTETPAHMRRHRNDDPAGKVIDDHLVLFTVDDNDTMAKIFGYLDGLAKNRTYDYGDEVLFNEDRRERCDRRDRHSRSRYERYSESGGEITAESFVDYHASMSSDFSKQVVLMHIPESLDKITAIGRPAIVAEMHMSYYNYLESRLRNAEVTVHTPPVTINTNIPKAETSNV